MNEVKVGIVEDHKLVVTETRNQEEVTAVVEEGETEEALEVVAAIVEIETKNLEVVAVEATVATTVEIEIKNPEVEIALVTRITDMVMTVATIKDMVTKVKEQEEIDTIVNLEEINLVAFLKNQVLHWLHFLLILKKQNH